MSGRISISFVDFAVFPLELIRFPLAHPDFAPFLQRARDAAPDAIFAFVVSGQGGDLRQAVRGAWRRQVGDQAHWYRRLDG